NKRATIRVADDLGLAEHPDHAAIAGQKAIHGAKWLGGGAGPGKFEVPAFAIFRMQLSMPKYRIIQPFLLRESKQVHDLRADVKLADAAVQGSHERDGRNLLDQ